MTDETNQPPSEGSSTHEEEHPAAEQYPLPKAEGEDQDQQEADQHNHDQQDEEIGEERLARLDDETEDDKADKPLDAETWGSTGHAVADEALRTLQNVGLSTDDAKELLFDAAMSRDPSKVDQKALASKIGPRRAKAIMDSLENFSRYMRPRDARVSNEVYQYSNGPKALGRLFEQGGEKLLPAEMQSYVIEISKGGPSAQRAVDRLQAAVTGEAVPLDRKVLTEQYSAPTPASQRDQAKGITSKAYISALDALHGPGSQLSFEARGRHEKELRAARRMGRKTDMQEIQ